MTDGFHDGFLLSWLEFWVGRLKLIPSIIHSSSSRNAHAFSVTFRPFLPLKAKQPDVVPPDHLGKTCHWLVAGLFLFVQARPARSTRPPPGSGPERGATIGWRTANRFCTGSNQVGLQ